MAQATEAPMLVGTTTSRWQRYGGIAGIVFSVLIAVDLFALPAMSITDPVAEIREFFVDNGDLLMTVAWVEAFLFAFVFLFFAACLRDTLAWSESVPTVFPRLSYTGAVVTAVQGAIGSLIWLTLSFNGAAVEDGTLQFLAEMEVMAFGFTIGFALALMAAASSVVILRTGVLTRWLGWLGIASALLMVVGAFWVLDGNDTGFLAIVSYVGVTVWLIWVLGVGVDMVRRTRATFTGAA